MRWSHFLAAAFFMAAAPLHAIDDQAPMPATAPQSAPSAPTCDCIVIPALTLVDIEILEPLSSTTSKDGDVFPIRLSSPIFVNGRMVVPAGITGTGQVIHAQKSGMGGGGGELLLAARYLDFDGRRLRLRSFRASRYGKSQTDTAIVTSLLAGPFGPAVKGKNTEFAAGSVAEAKIAEAFEVPLSQLPTSSSTLQNEASTPPTPTKPETTTTNITTKEDHK